MSRTCIRLSLDIVKVFRTTFNASTLVASGLDVEAPIFLDHCLERRGAESLPEQGSTLL